jgi:hypothetical protein
MTCFYYSYWSGLPMDLCEIYIRPRCVTVAFPTNDGLTLAAQIWPLDEVDAVRGNVEQAFYRSLDAAPGVCRPRPGGEAGGAFLRHDLAPQLLPQTIWSRLGVGGRRRLLQDPITAQGMRDAFRDADLLAGALVDGSPGALDEFERRRNQESAPIYEMTLQRASFAPPPPDAIALLTALRGNQEQTDRWAGIDAGSVSPAEFYSPENVARILEGASGAVAG